LQGLAINYLGLMCGYRQSTFLKTNAFATIIARQHAMHAERDIDIAIPSVLLSVRPMPPVLCV